MSYDALPEGSDDRIRATALHDTLLPEGLEFLLLAFPRQHAESERRLRVIAERNLDEDLDRLVGTDFVAALRTTHQAYGDALGITKASPLPAAPVLIVEPLRVLSDAITGYALQLLALARHDPTMTDAITIALSPIDEFRESVARRLVARDDDDDDDDTIDPVTQPPANAPVVLAPVA